ncbi:MAG TPA: nucleotidyltransferase domain-containing protein [Longimicrobium sp.]|uniref:nucleotidyltransferase domain-containing protein n=1 Tax=Longimicrobium sp. TaxID=2029185 RepID=UPI002ED872B9
MAVHCGLTAEALHTLARLRAEVSHLAPVDTTLVVYGSLARHEFTDGSDIDWTLLVDGLADPDHQNQAQRIGDRLREKGFRAPAPGGAFGNLTFSHDLIHRIGGEDDSNHNTTQRLLLLLESLPASHSGAYDRVVANVLARYIEEDLVSPFDTPYRVPRFLQNDVARYWRTMAVDFAHKRRVRSARGWALRTAKLRMSRKLMYAAGLLSCFSCETAFRDARCKHPASCTADVVEFLSEMVGSTPLDIVARVVLSYFGELSGAAGALFGAYDQFLGILHDPERREHLEQLAPARADSDPEYQRVREIGQRFQDGLTELFFPRDTPLGGLTMRYGVF